MEKMYVAYYRVSTRQQGNSGLGLEAQRTDVHNFTKCTDCILGEFTDVESGKNDNRVELTKAIELAKKNNATLVIAKLDRLSRNLTFISSLMDNKVKFVCCDMPEANEFTIHIFASLAQMERKLISTRTKSALAEVKRKYGKAHYKKGTVSNFNKATQTKGVISHIENAQNNENNIKALAMVKALAAAGNKPSDILLALQKSKFKTSGGGEFTQIVQVQRLLQKI